MSYLRVVAAKQIQLPDGVHAKDIQGGDTGANTFCEVWD